MDVATILFALFLVAMFAMHLGGHGHGSSGGGWEGGHRHGDAGEREGTQQAVAETGHQKAPGAGHTHDHHHAAT